MYIIDMNRVTLNFSSPFPLSFEELESRLSDRGYGNPSGRSSIIRINESGQPIQLQQLVKDKTEVVYDEQKGRLTISNESSIEKTLKEIEVVFKKVDTLKSLASSPTWYEVYVISRVLGKKHPLDKRASKSPLTTTIENLTGLEMRTFSRSICSFSGELPDRSLNTISNWVHITSGTFVPNPRYYQIRIIYRRTHLESIINFYKEIPSLILKLADDEQWGS